MDVPIFLKKWLNNHIDEFKNYSDFAFNLKDSKQFFEDYSKFYNDIAWEHRHDKEWPEFNRYSDIDNYSYDMVGLDNEIRWMLDEKMNHPSSRVSSSLKRANEANKKIQQIFEKYFDSLNSLQDLWDEYKKDGYEDDLIQEGLTEEKLKRYYDQVKPAADKIDKMSKVYEDFGDQFNRWLSWRRNDGPDRSEVKKLYHASVDADKVLKEGFKIKDDKDIEGLGGGTDNKISTTLSLDTARGIADAIWEMAEIANGKVNIGEFLDSIDPEIEEKAFTFGDINIAPMYFKKIGLDKIKERMRDGYVPRQVNERENLSDDAPEEKYDDSDIMTRWPMYRKLPRDVWKKLSDDEMKQTLMKIQNNVNWVESERENKYNPVFWGLDVKNFKNVDPDKIGLLEIEPDMTNPNISYHPGEYEYRLPLEAIKSVRKSDQWQNPRQRQKQIAETIKKQVEHPDESDNSLPDISGYHAVPGQKMWQRENKETGEIEYMYPEEIERLKKYSSVIKMIVGTAGKIIFKKD